MTTIPPDRSQPLRVEVVGVNDVRLDESNTRRHAPRNLEAIKSSLVKFGQRHPVVLDADGVVLAGNGRVLAARELGWEHLFAVRTELRGAEARAFSIADNRTAELAEWDYEGLAQAFEELTQHGIDLSDLGWDPHEVAPLMSADFTPLEHATADGSTAKPIRVTVEQRAAIDAAVAKVRASEGDADMSEGRCLELICAEYCS